MAMKRNILALFVVLSGLALFAGCGENANSATEQWVTEITLVNGEFQDTSDQANKEIANATTQEGLETAYARYAKALSEQKARLEEVNPPSACAAAQASMIHFIGRIASITEELSEISSASELASIESRINGAKEGLIRVFLPVAKRERC